MKANALDGGSKPSEKAPKISSGSPKIPSSKLPSADSNSHEEKTAQMKKNGKDVSLPSHDRPNPAKKTDIPIFKSNTIKVTQTLKAHSMAVSG